MYTKWRLFSRLAERELAGVCQLDDPSAYRGRGDYPRWIRPPAGRATAPRTATRCTSVAMLALDRIPR
eukprot:7167843-Pyramimonas_sp.AAC.1